MNEKTEVKVNRESAETAIWNFIWSYHDQIVSENPEPVVFWIEDNGDLSYTLEKYADCKYIDNDSWEFVIIPSMSCVAPCELDPAFEAGTETPFEEIKRYVDSIMPTLEDALRLANEKAMK